MIVSESHNQVKVVLFINLVKEGQVLEAVMSNCFGKYKLLEISRLLCHANMHTIELSRTFHQVTQLLHVCNTTKIVLL